MSWLTEFSNDADLTIIQDSKFKKIDMFTDMQNTLGAGVPAATGEAGAGTGAGAGATGGVQSSIKVAAPPGGKSSITF